MTVKTWFCHHNTNLSLSHYHLLLQSVLIESWISVLAIDLTIDVAYLLDARHVLHCLDAERHNIFTLLAGALNVVKTLLDSLVVSFSANRIQPCDLVFFNFIIDLQERDGYLFFRHIFVDADHNLFRRSLSVSETCRLHRLSRAAGTLFLLQPPCRPSHRSC